MQEKSILQMIQDKSDLADTSPETIAKQLGCNIELVKQTPSFRWADILYPTSLATAYYLVLTGKHYISEQKCDEILTNFINQKEYIAYFLEYRQALTPKIQELIMARVLVASFGIGSVKYDSVKPEHRVVACKFLNLPDTTYNQAWYLLESKNRDSNIEEQILGRLGYLLIWKDLSALEEKTSILVQNSRLKLLSDNSQVNNR